MADPSVVVCAAETWVKVATNVTSGIVHIKDPSVQYLQTYRATGNPAPDDLDDAVPLDPPGAPICATSGIDVYLYALGDRDGEARIDL